MRSISAPLEAILHEMDYDLPEQEVAGRLAQIISIIHDRFKANSKSPHCDGRDRICAVLDEAYEKLSIIEEG